MSYVKYNNFCTTVPYGSARTLYKQPLYRLVEGGHGGQHRDPPRVSRGPPTSLYSLCEIAQSAPQHTHSDVLLVLMGGNRFNIK
jgi:hypothetical protein